MVSIRAQIIWLSCAIFLASCGGDPSDRVPADRGEPLRLTHNISSERSYWKFYRGGASQRSDGLFIDLERTGDMQAAFEISVREQTDLSLDLQIDANGEQGLQIVLLAGCHPTLENQAKRQRVHLNDGRNAVTVSQTVSAPFKCVQVKLSGPSNPVSLIIEDATLTWSE